MGWTGHKFNEKHKAQLFVRGGGNGFSGAFLKIGNNKIEIENPDLFENIVFDKLMTEIIRKHESWSSAKTVRNYLGLDNPRFWEK